MIGDSLRFLVAKILAVSMASLFSMGCSGSSSSSNKPHHTTSGFRNIHNYHKSPTPGFLDLLKWRWERGGKDIPAVESYQFPLAKNDPEFLRSNDRETTLTWIGHATVLLQLNGKNILTDPNFSERASPTQWAGPKRVVPPGLPLKDLPRIDAVVLSHDHYDSLDSSTVWELFNRPGGDKTTFFVPLRLKEWFEDLGIQRVVEMDWWDRRQFDGLEIIAVPVHHWSKRGFFGRNQTLWAGWVIRSNDFSFLFAGDSGYTPHFKEIGDKLGPFDLAAIPIGAYEPRWFMKHYHITPEEAVRVHLDTRSKKSVAIHWGTFILTDEPLDEPPKRLKEAKEGRRVPKDDFVVLKHGQTIVLNKCESQSG